MTKKEIVLETLEYYSDKTRKGINKRSHRCEYETKDGRYCAVGRCMILETRAKVVSLNKGISWLLHCLNKDNLDDVLLEKYRGHEVQFWMQLQPLHDKDLDFPDSDYINEILNDY